jgi:hypothetical protein
VSVRSIAAPAVRDDLQSGLLFAIDPTLGKSILSYVPRQVAFAVSTATGSVAIYANGPAGPGYVVNPTGSRWLKGVDGAGNNVPLFDIPANSDWTMQVVVSNVGSSGSNPAFFRSNSTATGSTFDLGNGAANRPWVRVAGTNILNPGSGASWTTGQHLNKITRFKNAASVDCWWDGKLQHTATHAVSQDAAGVYILGQQSATYITGNWVAVRFWTRWLPDEVVADLQADQANFYGRRIWVPVSAGGSSLDLTQTTGVALSGSVSVSGDIQIGTNFNLTQSNAVGLTGSLATTGDVQIGTTFNLAQTAAVGLAGSVGVSGDLQILSGSLDLTQTSAVAMSGTVGLSGDIQIGTSFDLAQTAAVGLTGSVATTGNIQIGTNFNLAQSVALAMSGSVAVTGDLQSGTAPVVTQAYGNFGWDPRIRPSWKRKELREELEAALDDAPKAVQVLVRVPGPDISEVPVREALEVVRTARKHRERAVTRQEIDELHEALETVATFTREREATRQARRRKQQHLLLLS